MSGRRAAWRLGVAPVLFYLICFLALTWPLIARFSTHFFADHGDGLQGVWSFWWVDRALRAGQSPWFTDRLYHPDGVTLVPHALNAFNGLLATVLLRVLTVAQTHNVIVLVGFVGTGWTTFLLAHHLTRHWAGSLLAGYLFTFSSFHFAHAAGHYHLVSLEWMPAFFLLWHRFLEAPRIRIGLAAAFGLFLVLLCDYYQFVYAVLAGSLLAGWHVAARRDAGFLVRPGRRGPVLAFVAACLVTSGPLVLSLVSLARRDPLVGTHPADIFSTDLLAGVIPDGHWRFHRLTTPVWSTFTGGAHEASVSLGVAALVLAGLAWRRRRGFPDPSLRAWFAIGLVFWLLSLGPVLRVAGRELLRTMPYTWLEQLLPPLRMSGVPARMMVVVQLAVALLAAHGWARLASGSGRARAIAALAVIATAIELLPTPIPTTPAAVPRYVEVLRDQPGDGALVDLVNSDPYQLLHQTVHGKPLLTGYLARIPASVERRREEVVGRLARRDRPTLCSRYRLRFLLLSDRHGPVADIPGAQVLHREGDVSLLSIACPSPAGG